MVAWCNNGWFNYAIYMDSPCNSRLFDFAIINLYGFQNYTRCSWLNCSVSSFLLVKNLWLLCLNGFIKFWSQLFKANFASTAKYKPSWSFIHNFSTLYFFCILICAQVCCVFLQINLCSCLELLFCQLLGQNSFRLSWVNLNMINSL